MVCRGYACARPCLILSRDVTTAVRQGLFILPEHADMVLILGDLVTGFLLCMMINHQLPNRGATIPRQYQLLRSRLGGICTPKRPRIQPCRATEPQTPRIDDEDDDFEGLAEEDDWVVPGNNMGSLSLNTELGRAVDGACDELEHLAGMETDILQEADDILKKFGFKSGILTAPTKESDSPDAEQQ